MPTMEPATDAKWCIEQLFKYIELHVKSRVTAKIGRARNLEASKLSNLGSNAAMAHPSKALTPLSSARWRQTTMPISMTSQQRMRLREIFIYYCSWAEKHNYLYMSRTQFLKLCRDCHIMGPRLSAVTLNLIFEKVHLDCAEPMPGVRLGLNDWMQALLRISAALFREASPQEAFDSLLEEHVLRAAAPGAAAARHEDRLAEAVLRQDVLEVLNAARPHIRPIFNFYINEQQFLDLGGSGGGWKEVLAARNRMPLNSFVRFGQDFELVPQLLTKTQLVEAFRCSRFGPSGGTPGGGAADAEPEDMARIGFEEFVEALGRLALVAFNFQEPASELQHIEFKESYAAAAKQLWVEDVQAAREAEASFPDEVAMPAAELEQCIGNDDRAHMDDVMSRAASKVFGKARSSLAVSRHQKVSQSPGLEVMHVHDEAPVLATSRPLHLTHFTTDWVGRPGTPQMETAQLKKLELARPAPKDQGWYNTDQDLPPVFVDRAQRMIDARIIREQLSEGLRLGFKAEQRRSLRDGLACSKTLRQQLQVTSGQRLVGESSGHWAYGDRGSGQEAGGMLPSPRRFEQQQDMGATAGSSVSGCSSVGFQQQLQQQQQQLVSLPAELAPGRKGVQRLGRSTTLLEEIQGLMAGVAASKQ